MPEYIFVHHKRMSFIEGGGTDSVAYAHYVWRKGYYPEFAKIKVIQDVNSPIEYCFYSGFEILKKGVRGLCAH